MGKYAEKINSFPKQKKIKAALEELGHTNIEVWWENIGSNNEMSGPDGGYFFHSDQCELEPLGYSFTEAMEGIDSWEWLDVRETGGNDNE